MHRPARISECASCVEDARAIATGVTRSSTDLAIIHPAIEDSLGVIFSEGSRNARRELNSAGSTCICARKVVARPVSRGGRRLSFLRDADPLHPI